MNKILTILFLIFLAVGCQNKPSCNLNKEVLRINDSIILKLKSEKLLSPYLNKVKEPELDSFGEETYRFMINSSFGSNEIYRINKDIDSYTITSKNYWTSFNDKEVDSLGKETKTRINEKDWLSVKNLIDQLNFWCIPVKENEHYLDGIAYVIEGYNPEKNECTNRNYQVTVRMCPRDSTRYKSVFNKIIKLASKQQ